MARKIYDLAVKTGTYQVNGETKGRYENVGAVMQSDDGSQYMMLKRTFNPAGAPFKDGSDAILVSMFAPKEQSGAPQQRQRPAQQASGHQGGGTPQGPDDDIPFAPRGWKEA